LPIVHFVIVDSYRFLPRSFVPMYENPAILPGEEDPVWTPFEPRLADASIAMISSAGLSLEGEQEPFDLDRERREPTWGDPSFRVLPHDLGDRALAMSHLHVNNTDVLADRNVALPVDVLDEVVAEGRVGSAAPSHVSVMGYQEGGLEVWRNETAPAIIELLRSQETSGVILAPV
jgi:D-proline reductase (dithiol) PrdB